MNYLAHVFLSSESRDAIVGGLLGDFVKGAAIDAYRSEIGAGILLHRRIDRYTDAHAVVRESRRLISAPRRRFAGIMVDVFYDHFLVRHWNRFSEVPLAVFTRRVYGQLLPQRASFPERLQRMLPRMVADDWLGSYGRMTAVDAALRGIARRFKHKQRAEVLADSARELVHNYPQLENHFLTFFPQLMHYAEQCKQARVAARRVRA